MLFSEVTSAISLDRRNLRKKNCRCQEYPYIHALISVCQTISISLTSVLRSNCLELDFKKRSYLVGCLVFNTSENSKMKLVASVEWLYLGLNRRWVIFHPINSPCLKKPYYRSLSLRNTWSSTHGWSIHLTPRFYWSNFQI